MMQFELLGFQLRIIAKKIKWSQERRQQYLLIQDIRYPLSVDKTVWPYHENKEDKASMFQDSDIEDSPPNGLNVYNLKNMPSQNYKNKENFTLVAITTTPNAASSLKEMHKINSTSYTIEDIKNSNWEFLGYDIADKHLISGLMNFGHSKEEKDTLLSTYISNINLHGLLSTGEIAQKYANHCNDRYKNHAPFFIYGLCKP